MRVWTLVAAGLLFTTVAQARVDVESFDYAFDSTSGVYTFTTVFSEPFDIGPIGDEHAGRYPVRWRTEIVRDVTDDFPYLAKDWHLWASASPTYPHSWDPSNPHLMDFYVYTTIPCDISTPGTVVFWINDPWGPPYEWRGLSYSVSWDPGDGTRGYLAYQNYEIPAPGALGLGLLGLALVRKARRFLMC